MSDRTYSTVFVVGSPRSGKTLLQNIIGFHEQMAWFSQFNSRFSTVPLFGMLNNLYDIPLMGRCLLRFSRSRYLPHPEEISSNYIPLTRQYGSLTEHDVTERDARTIQSIAERQLHYQKKRMLIADCGRPARLRFFNAIFPDSKFIHVIRDGRDVVAACLSRYPYMFTEEKRLDDYFPQAPQALLQMAQDYKGNDDYRLVFAALYWKIAIREIEKQSEALINPVHVVRYEDLLNDPDGIVTRALSFLDLPMTDRINRILKIQHLSPAQDDKAVLNARQHDLLSRLFNDELIRYNYEP